MIVGSNTTKCCIREYITAYFIKNNLRLADECDHSAAAVTTSAAAGAVGPSMWRRDLLKELALCSKPSSSSSSPSTDTDVDHYALSLCASCRAATQTTRTHAFARTTTTTRHSNWQTFAARERVVAFRLKSSERKCPANRSAGTHKLSTIARLGEHMRLRVCGCGYASLHHREAYAVHSSGYSRRAW